MRHNKLAGTRFLLGSRKHKPSTFTSSGADDITTDCNCSNTKTSTTTNNNMLHSKSTYFYRWFRESLDLVVSGLSAKNTNKTSKASKTSYLVPAVCGAALLCGVGIVVNPTASSVQRAYAATDTTGCKTTADNKGICAMELAIFMNGTDAAYNELPATELSTDNVVHRDYNFSVRAVDTKDGYNLYAGVVNTGSFGNNLVNADYPTEEHMIKALSGTDVAYSSIGNNEWGYAITSTNQNAEELNYNSLPVATITTEGDKTILTNGKLLAHGEDTGYDPSQPVGEDKHTDQDYKLYFAAKAGPDSPAGHYRTQVMLSLVADPKIVGGLGNITKMSELTAEHCKNNIITPAADAAIADIPTAQLIDDREGNNGTKYWVSKLADGNCWMTQNMAYAQNNAITVNNGRVLNGSQADSVDGMRASEEPTLTGVYNADKTEYNAHYRIGNYYSHENVKAVCPSGWKLPSGDRKNGSFAYLLDMYGIGESSQSSTIDWLTIESAPLYFIRAGYPWNGSSTPGSVGTEGGYWSITVGPFLELSSNGRVDPTHSLLYEYYKYNIRCLVSGS